MTDRVARRARVLACFSYFSFVFEQLFQIYRALLEYKLTYIGQRPASCVAFVEWAFQSMSHGSYPDFLPSFFPTRVFSGRFFLASVLTVFFVNCRSALF